MIQTIDAQRSRSFREFLVFDFPDEGRYELVNGEIVRILATRQHDNIAEFIADAFKAEFRRLGLNYRVSGRVMVRTQSAGGQEQGRVPDVSVVDRTLWDATYQPTLPSLSPCRWPLRLFRPTGKTTTSIS